MRSLLIFILSCGVVSNSYSQNFTFFGFLPAYSQTGLISKKVDYNFFASTTYSAFSRTYDHVNYPAKFLQIYIQPSVIYKISTNWNFSVSVTYNYQRNNPIFLISENGGLGNRWCTVIPCGIGKGDFRIV
jgi:hypothetical protein